MIRKIIQSQLKPLSTLKTENMLLEASKLKTQRFRKTIVNTTLGKYLWIVNPGKKIGIGKQVKEIVARL